MTSKPDGGAAPEPAAHRGAMGLKGSAHWVSRRMSAAPAQRASAKDGIDDTHADAGAAGTQVSPPAVAIHDGAIAAIDAARGEPTGTLSDAALREAHAVRNLPVLVVQPPLDTSHGLAQRRDPARPGFAFVGWSVVAFGTLGAVVTLTTLGGLPRAPVEAPAPRTDTPDAPLLRAGERAPHFESLARAAEPEQATAPAAPGIVVTTGAIAAAGDVAADFDPLERVTVSGLPERVHLSVGYRTSSTDWAIAPADLDRVRLVVPHDQEGPVRAELAFASRAGVVLARMGLAIEHQPSPVVLVALKGLLEEAEPVLAEAETLVPAGASRALATAAWAPALMAPAPFAADEISVMTLPETRERKGKSRSREKVRARAAKPSSAAAVSQPAVRLPRGLFPLEPAKGTKGTKTAKAATEAAAKPKAEPTAPAVAVTPAAAEPKPQQKALPAALPTGHQIQSTLGGGFSVAAP